MCVIALQLYKNCFMCWWRTKCSCNQNIYSIKRNKGDIAANISVNQLFYLHKASAHTMHLLTDIASWCWGSIYGTTYLKLVKKANLLKYMIICSEKCKLCERNAWKIRMSSVWRISISQLRIPIFFYKVTHTRYLFYDERRSLCESGTSSNRCDAL